MTYTLYYTPGACSLAPHIILREIGAEFNLVAVDLMTHKTKDGADFYKINPKGYVPALRLMSGEIVTEGPAITQYLADNNPGTELAPKPGTLDRARTQEWLTFIGTEIHKLFPGLFNPALGESEKQALKDKIGQRLSLIEHSLADGRPYLGGQTFSVADAYLFVVTNSSLRVGIDMAAFSKLRAFHARVTARPHTQAAMKAEGLI